MGVSISDGNSKMGMIKSVSLPSIVTCIKCECNDKCYARKIERIRPNVLASYIKNLSILKEDPERYWSDVESAIKTSRYFRFHVSGDIPDDDYFSRMVNVAIRNSKTDMLCFTKKYNIVNNYLSNGGVLPDNLHIIFSGWVNLKMVNPFSLPEAHVRFKNGFTEASESAIECNGNCTECATFDKGCWTLHTGEQVVFNEQ